MSGFHPHTLDLMTGSRVASFFCVQGSVVMCLTYWCQIRNGGWSALHLDLVLQPTSHIVQAFLCL